MAACSTGYYEYYIRDNGGGSYDYFQWNKTSKTVVVINRSTIPSSDYFPLENGAIVDAREFAGRVQLVVIDYSAVSNFYLRYVDLSSTNGDTRNRFMFKAFTGGDTLSIRMYAVGLQEVTNLSFPLQTTYTAPVSGYPSNGYVFTPGTFSCTPCVSSQIYAFTLYTCDGYTRNKVVGIPGSVTFSSEINSPFCGYAASVVGGHTISEKKTFKIERCIPENPIYIGFLNTLGGWEQFLFGVTQSYELDVTSDGSYSENYVSIADTTNPDKTIKKRAQERMRLGASNLTQNQKDALKDLLYSPKVYILNSDLSINMEVNIIPATYQIKKTDVALSTIEFEILLPEIVTIGN